MVLWMQAVVAPRLADSLPAEMTTVATAIHSPAPRWRERLNAMSNVPPVFRMVWEAAPGIVTSGMIFRFAAALLPLAMLAVTRVIIDSIYAFTSHQKALPRMFWW